MGEREGCQEWRKTAATICLNRFWVRNAFVFGECSGLVCAAFEVRKLHANGLLKVGWHRLETSQSLPSLNVYCHFCEGGAKGGGKHTQEEERASERKRQSGFPSHRRMSSTVGHALIREWNRSLTKGNPSRPSKLGGRWGGWLDESILESVLKLVGTRPRPPPQDSPNCQVPQPVFPLS